MSNIALFCGFCRDSGIEHSCNALLKQHCTFCIGGAADIIIFPSDIEQIVAVTTFAKQKDIPLLVLGKGSNILFSDVGFAGAVLKLGRQFAGIKLIAPNKIYCDSGISLAKLCAFAMQNSLSGLEFAFGIPGTVGGAIYMNAGAYGGEIIDVLERANHVTTSGQLGSFAGKELELSYRHSVYTSSDMVITGGVFALKPADKADILASMRDFYGRRKDKQPLEYPSAGSTFRRPKGNYASALIDQCGLKGKCVGGAMVSEKHAGFVINHGGATSADVRELIAQVVLCVKEKTGYQLECEVKIID